MNDSILRGFCQKCEWPDGGDCEIKHPKEVSREEKPNIQYRCKTCKGGFAGQKEGELHRWFGEYHTIALEFVFSLAELTDLMEKIIASKEYENWKNTDALKKPLFIVEEKYLPYFLKAEPDLVAKILAENDKK